MHHEMSGPRRVLAQHRGRWLVSSEDQEARLLPARGSLRDTPPVTGDWVEIDAAGAISALLERRGTLVRRAAGEAAAAQVLAANVDLALVVEALPDPNERRAERLVALALAGGVPGALVLTKSDLARDGQEVATRLARRLGLADGVAVSARDGAGLAILRTLPAPGATAALIGRSGVGKSTLVNALLGESRQATQPVRAGDGRGRHTTVTRELIELPPSRTSRSWPPAAASRNCRHESEPGCAVRDAVDPERLGGWRKLRREQARLEDRKAAARARKESARALTRQARAAQRAKRRD
jgi:ribosome biogenesis GTPase